MPVSYIDHRIYSQLLYFSHSINMNYTNNYKSYKNIKLLHDIHPNPGPKYNLSVGYTNIRSLFSDTDNSMLIDVQDCKFNDVIREFSYINNCDIIFLTETWLQYREMDNYQLHIDGYRNPIYNNRDTFGGGLLIYYKKNYKVDTLNELQNDNIEHLVISLNISQKVKFLFNLIYRSPTSHTNVTDYINNNLYEYRT